MHREFDLHEWETYPEGITISTRDGRKARILSTDIGGGHPVAYAVESKTGDGELVRNCDECGRIGLCDNDDDLFIDDGIELSDLQKEIKRLMLGGNEGKVIADNLVAREVNKILSLVEKQEIKEGITRRYSVNGKEVTMEEWVKHQFGKCAAERKESAWKK